LGGRAWGHLLAAPAGDDDAKRRALTLHRSPLDDDGSARALLDIEFERLHDLALSCCGLGSRGGARLAARPWLAQLESLDLLKNKLTCADACGIVRNARALTSLQLRGNRFGGQLAPLVREPTLATLRMLFLGRTELDDDDAVALAQSPVLAGLEILDVADNRIGDRGARALAASPYLTGLTELWIGRLAVEPGRTENTFGAAARAALEERFQTVY
jgi:hypothetical protein